MFMKKLILCMTTFCMAMSVFCGESVEELADAEGFVSVDVNELVDVEGFVSVANEFMENSSSAGRRDIIMLFEAAAKFMVISYCEESVLHMKTFTKKYYKASADCDRELLEKLCRDVLPYLPLLPEIQTKWLWRYMVHSQLCAEASNDHRYEESVFHGEKALYAAEKWDGIPAVHLWLIHIHLLHGYDGLGNKKKRDYHRTFLLEQFKKGMSSIPPTEKAEMFLAGLGFICQNECGILLRQKKYQEALPLIQQLKMVYDKNPESSANTYFLVFECAANVYVKMKDWKSAKLYAEKGIEAMGKSAGPIHECYIPLLRASIALKEEEIMLQKSKQYLEKYKNRPSGVRKDDVAIIQYCMGKLYLRQNKKSEAEECFRTASKQRPLSELKVLDTLFD